MTRLHQPLIEQSQKTGEPLKSFDTANGVVTATYCVDSGKLVTDACRHDPRGSRIETGYFTMETAPTAACDVHVLVDWDKVTGAVACEDCPPENITQIALVQVEDRDFPAEVTVSDAQYVYRAWEARDGVTDSTSLPFFHALLGEDRYCGTSGTTTRAINSFCHEHYVDRTDETETEAETEAPAVPPAPVTPTAPVIPTTPVTPPAPAVTEPLPPESPVTEAPPAVTEPIPPTPADPPADPPASGEDTPPEQTDNPVEPAPDTPPTEDPAPSDGNDPNVE